MKVIIFKRVFIFFAIIFFSSSCAVVSSNVENNSNLSVAVVQKEIKIGMSSSDVIEVLGSPNIITTDDKRRETWVYDKISTTITSSNSSVGGWLLVFGSSSKYQTSSTQKTLTIIIKYDEKGLVRDFSYRTSQF